MISGQILYASIFRPMVALAVFTVVLCCPIAVRAEINGNSLPDEAKGYQESGYSLSDYENVNLVNGNLTWRLPLYTLSTDGGLTYELALQNNSKIWYRFSYCNYGGSGYACPDTSIDAEANVADGVANYGFGWDLRPPRILFERSNDDRPRNERPSHVFVDQSGARRTLHDTPAWESLSGPSEENVFFTRDGTNLRFKFFPNEAHPTSVVMDDGSGTRYVFEQLVPDTCDYDLGTQPFYGDLSLSPFNFRMEVAGLYLSRIERGPWSSSDGEDDVAANRIVFDYRGSSASESSALCFDSDEERWLLSEVSAYGVDGYDNEIKRSVNLEYGYYYPDATRYLKKVHVPKFDSTLGISERSTGYATIDIETEASEFRQKNTGVDADLGCDSVTPILCLNTRTLSKVEFPGGARFVFNEEGELEETARETILDVTLPSGAKVSYEYDFESWIQGRGRCVSIPTDGPSVWVSCGMKVPIPHGEVCKGNLGLSNALYSRGVAKRKIDYDDASGAARIEYLHLSNKLDCSTNGALSSAGMWLYDFSYLPIDKRDYYWTIVFTSDEEFPLGTEEAKGIAKIHRFNVGALVEFSVDHLAGDVGQLLLNLVGGGTQDEYDALLGKPIRRLRHTEIEHELGSLFGYWSGGVDAFNLKYSFVRDQRTYTPSVLEFPEEADIGHCYLSQAAGDQNTTTPTCPVVSNRVTPNPSDPGDPGIDDYLNITYRKISSMNSVTGIGIPEVTRTHSANFDVSVGDWYLHRSTSNESCEPDSTGVTVCSSVERRYENISDPGATPDFRVSTEVTNPATTGGTNCFEDCIKHVFDYDSFGNLDEDSVTGGMGLGTDLTGHKIGTAWAHGRPVERRLYVGSDSLLLWEREADPNTGLYRWHLDGSGSGVAYLYDGLGKVTDIAKVYRDWENDGNIRIQTDEDGVTPLKGVHINYQYPPAYPLLEHEVYDATWETADIGDYLVSPSFETASLRSTFLFDGLGRLTQEKERYPGANQTTRSRFFLDFLYDHSETSQYSICNGFQDDWDLGYKTRVQVTSTWIDGEGWPSGGCGEDTTLDWSETQFDTLGRPVVIRQPDGFLLTNDYGGDLLVKTTRKVAFSTGTEGMRDRHRLVGLDGLGRIRMTAEQVGEEITDRIYSAYVYDHADRLVSVTLEGDQKRTFNYSPAGFLMSSDEPERYTEYKSYDEFGNLLLEHTSPNSDSQVISSTIYEYDDFSRLKLKKAGEPDDEDYLAFFSYYPISSSNEGKPTYNKLQKSEQLNWFRGESATVWHEWKYNGPGGRVSSRSTGVGDFGIGGDGDGFEIEYSYDLLGNVDGVTQPLWKPWRDTCPDAISVEQRYTYDGGWLTDAYLFRDKTAHSAASLSYHPNGRPHTTIMSAVVDAEQIEVARQTEAADDSGLPRPADLFFEANGIGKWSQTDFAYDGSGNVASFDVWADGYVESAREFTYDGLNRLTAFHSDDLNPRSYTYDSYGNLETFGDTTIIPDTTTNRISSINSVTIPPHVANEYWDVRGNLLKIPAFSAQQRAKELVFSAEDRLMQSIDVGSGSIWRYAYDTSGERVVAWSTDGNGNTAEARITLRNEAGSVLTDWSLIPGSSLIRQRDYLYAGSRMITQVDWGESLSTRRYAAADHLGSTRYLLGINEAGNVVEPGETFEYYPFGAFKQGDYGANSTHLFTGHERDIGLTLSELDYMHARYYSPNLGRFVSVDPVSGKVGSSQSWNRYAYAKNSPLNRLDPDGLTDIDITIRRQTETANSTIGTYRVEGSSISGSTLELPDRGNRTNVSRIPAGNYPARRSTFSDGRDVIRVDNVPSRTGIAIHAGNTPSNTTGCILVGKTSGTDRVNNSGAAMGELLGYVDTVAALDSMLGETTSISVNISDLPGPIETDSPTGFGASGLEASDFRDPLGAIVAVTDEPLDVAME